MATGRMSDIPYMTAAGVDVVFNRAAKMPMQKYYPQICEEKSQVKVIGNYHTIGDLGAAMLKPEGDDITYRKISENLKTSITSRIVANGVEATEEQLEADLENVVKQQFGTPLLATMLDYKEKQIHDVYNDGFSATGADGVYMFSASHPLSDSVLLNDNLATGALTPDNFIAAKMKFYAIKNQAGRRFATRPTHLLISEYKQHIAFQIIQSELVAFELSNTKNVSNDVLPVKVIASPFIDYTASTGVAPWFLLDRSLKDAGVILQTKRGIKLQHWWEEGPSIYKGKVSEWYGSGFISAGYGLVGSPGT